MPRIDDAAEIRALAYQIWEQEGCPSGREHEHWAQANRIYAQLHPAESRHQENRTNEIAAVPVGRSEIERLRLALWTPEPFSAEFYPNEIPEQRTVWRRQRPMSEPVATAGAQPSIRRVASGNF